MTHTHKDFWKSILRAVEAKPMKVDKVKGRSGLDHPVLGVGVDGSRSRVVVVSEEADARSAALAQADIQAAHPDHKIVLIRPVAANLPAVAQVFAEFLGKAEFAPGDWEQFKSPEEESELPPAAKEVMELALKAGFEGFGSRPMGMLSQLMQVVTQVKLIDWDWKEGDTPPVEVINQRPVLSFDRLLQSDPIGLDRDLGIGAIPLYSFEPDEQELVREGTRVDQIRQLLTDKGILQYFFPPPDQLALALVDHGLRKPLDVMNHVVRSTDYGHPLGDGELGVSVDDIDHVVSHLEERGFLVEGEFGFELSQEGQSVRGQVKFKPREGLVTKLMQRVSLNVGDLFRHLVGLP